MRDKKVQTKSLFLLFVAFIDVKLDLESGGDGKHYYFEKTKNGSKSENQQEQK